MCTQVKTVKSANDNDSYKWPPTHPVPSRQGLWPRSGVRRDVNADLSSERDILTMLERLIEAQAVSLSVGQIPVPEFPAEIQVSRKSFPAFRQEVCFF